MQLSVNNGALLHSSATQVAVPYNVTNWKLTGLQWRNSYGLRVGKPAGTRAEGAPAGCPFTQAFQLILLFHTGASFQHFPIVWLRNSYNDAFHKLIKWQNYLGALSKGRGGGAGGVTSHM